MIVYDRIFAKMKEKSGVKMKDGQKIKEEIKKRAKKRVLYSILLLLERNIIIHN